VLKIEPKRVTLTTADEIFVEQMLTSIEKNMSNPDYSVEDLGVEVGLSRTQLYRKLKALTGQSANEFIRTIRLKRAAQLLEQNQLTIAEVTYEVGFSDLQYFRECFKKLFGLTPSEYAQKATGKQVVE
jgi:transcriptional regulator GlxA family with amidase domain